MKKGFVSLVLALVLCLSLMPAVPVAATSQDSDFIIENGVLRQYVGPGGDVVIPDGVTEIGRYCPYWYEGVYGLPAFGGCTNVTSIVMPDSVTTLTDQAFDGCSSLKSVRLSNNLENISYGAFWNCKSLESIDIPASVKEIGSMAFDSCENLSSVTLHDGLGCMFGFRECPSLKELTIPGTVKSFSCSGLPLEQVTLKEGITSIPDAAFGDCKNLKRIEIPSTVTSIGKSAFQGCTSLETMTIPKNVTRINGWPFALCSALETLVFSDNSPLYKGLNYEMFSEYVQRTPHLEEIVNCPSPTLQAHIKANTSVREQSAGAMSVIEPQSRKVQALSDEITAGITSDYEKAKAISQWVCKNIEYDYDYYTAGIKDYSDIPFTPEEVIDSCMAVCAGYARLTQALLEAQGIPALYITGPSNGRGGWQNHAWNLAYIDGDWVWIDNTWGMDYFDAGTVFLSASHIAKGATFFSENHVRNDVTADVEDTESDPKPDPKPDDSQTKDPVQGGGQTQTGGQNSSGNNTQKPEIMQGTGNQAVVTDAQSAADAATEWARAEVKAAIENSLVPTDLQSAYTAAITRQEFCRLMVSLVEQATGMDIDAYLSSKGLTAQSTFTDTSDANVAAAHALGIVYGQTDTVFAPGNAITRQEAATMLSRAAKLLGLTAGNTNPFSDAGQFASWAQDGIAYVSGLVDPANGYPVMGGMGNGTFAPAGTYTREQAIATTLRLYHCAA